MADTNTGADTSTQNGGGAAAEGNEESPNADSSQAGNDSEGGTDGDGEGDGGEGDEGEDGDGESDEDEDDDIQDDDAEPPVRRDNSYFVGLRHGKKAAKTAAKKGTKGDEGSGDEGEGDGDDEEGDDIHPDDAAILEDAVAKAVKPLTEKLAAQEDREELNEFLGKNPAFKPYQKRIERFMKHPSRAHLPITTVAMEAVGPEGMMKIGARMARSADTKKQTSKGGNGSGPRGGAAKPKVWDMPDKDFSAMQDEVRRKA